MKIINKFEALDMIRETNGQVFSVAFTKKDGTVRHMNCRTGVKKHLAGGELKFDPKSKGLFSVYDMQVKGYRFINLNTIQGLQIAGEFYTVR